MAQMLIQLTMKSLYWGQNTVRRTERERSDREKGPSRPEGATGYDNPCLGSGRLDRRRESGTIMGWTMHGQTLGSGYGAGNARTGNVS